VCTDTLPVLKRDSFEAHLMAAARRLVVFSLLVAVVLAADGGGSRDKTPPSKSLSATGSKPPSATVKPATVQPDKLNKPALPKGSARSRLRAVAAAGHAMEHVAVVRAYLNDPTKLLQIPVGARTCMPNAATMRMRTFTSHVSFS